MFVDFFRGESILNLFILDKFKDFEELTSSGNIFILNSYIIRIYGLHQGISFV